MSMNVNDVANLYSNKDYFPKTATKSKADNLENAKSKNDAAVEYVKDDAKAYGTDKSASGISAKNEAKLSKKAQDFLATLREKYGDYDFMVGNSTDDMRNLEGSGSKEFSVIFSSAELERMANDEKYANEKMQGVEGAVKMCKRINEEYGFPNGAEGSINKITIAIGDDGSMKIFAELEKSSAKQKERIEAAKEQKAEAKKDAEKKEKAKKANSEDESVKRTTIEASSEEDLIEQLKNLDWSKISESHSGDKINFTV